MAAKKKSVVSSPPKKSVAGSKETIYVDVDDEITHIIDKIKASKAKIIALVLPKRAPVLQSLVNMKLLKRSAVNARKNLVLITTESGLLPLAGAASLHVAKSLNSKPEIPPSPDMVTDEVEDLDVPEGSLDKSQPIGALAATSVDSDDDVIEFDNIKIDDLDTTAATGVKPSKTKSKKDKKLKVPNFEKFRLGIVLAVLAVLLLIGGSLLAFVVLPKATIVIETDTTTVVSSFDFTAGVDIQDVDTQSMKVPAEVRQVKKTEAEKGTATGERDEGTRASGEVTLSIPCSSGGFLTSVPAGTAVSNNDLNYITQERAILSTPGGSGGSDCVFRDTVRVLATENGDRFNLGDGKSFTVAGFSSVTGRNSDDIDGGTSKIVKFVTQSDVEQAVDRIRSRQGDSVSDELASQLESSRLFAIKETLVASDPKIQPSPAVDAEASEFSVSYEVEYSMLGVLRSDMVELVRGDVEGELDLEKQSIVNDGIDAAVMRINNSKPDQAFISFRTSVVAGPELNESEIKEEVRGKKLGEVESYVKGIVGVRDVEVNYSPFWVYTTPKSAKKITIIIDESSDEVQDNSGSNE